MGAINTNGFRASGAARPVAKPYLSAEQSRQMMPARPSGVIDAAEDVTRNQMTYVDKPSGEYVETGSAFTKRRERARRESLPGMGFPG